MEAEIDCFQEQITTNSMVISENVILQIIYFLRISFLLHWYNTFLCTRAIFIAKCIRNAHISYIEVIDYGYIIYHIFCHIINAIEVMID